MRRSLIISMLLVLIAGCSLISHEAPLEDVEKAGALFFQRFEKHDYEAIHKDIAQRFKENKTKQEVTDSLGQIGEYGKLGDYRRISTTFEGEGKDRMVSPVYAVLFEKERGELTLNFVDEAGEWKLIGFSFKARRS